MVDFLVVTLAYWRPLLKYSQDNNDPRLSKIANPSAGGSVTINKPVEGEQVALI